MTNKKLKEVSEKFTEEELKLIEKVVIFCDTKEKLRYFMEYMNKREKKLKDKEDDKEN